MPSIHKRALFLEKFNFIVKQKQKKDYFFGHLYDIMFSLLKERWR